MNSNGIHLVLGGSRSGKSERAEQLVKQSNLPVTYMATCRRDPAVDEEMRERIQKHQSRRPAEWELVENRFDLAEILKERPDRIVLMDCLTLWIAERLGQLDSVQGVLDELNAALEGKPASTRLVIVSNEVGSGIVPCTASTRRFRDLSGWANQAAARHAEQVDWITAGLWVPLKREGKACHLDMAAI